MILQRNFGGQWSLYPKSTSKFVGRRSLSSNKTEIPDVGHVLFERGCSNLVSHKLKYSPNRFQSVFLDISIPCSLGGSNQYVRHMKLSRLVVVGLV